MTSLLTLKSHWTEIGREDPLFGVLTQPGKENNRWEMSEFMQTGRADVQRMLRFAANHEVTIRRAAALDFGCGVGRLTQALCQEFDQVCGVDISTSMLDVARAENRFGARCALHELAADGRIDFPDQSFDFICSLITLQHIRPEYAKGYLREFARLLAPGGVIVFQVPDSVRRPSWFRRRVMIPLETTLRRFRRKQPPAAEPLMVTRFMEMHCVPEPEVVAVLSACGVDVVAAEPDDAAGAHFISKRYVAVRAA